MPPLINFSLAREPYNWLIVILMLAIGVLALNLLTAPLGQIGGAAGSVL